MLEPITICGAVVGILSGLYTHCETLIKYSKDCKNLDNDIENLRAQMENLNTRRKLLNRLLINNEELGDPLGQAQTYVQSRMEDCERAAKRVDDMLSQFVHKHGTATSRQGEEPSCKGKGKVKGAKLHMHCPYKSASSTQGGGSGTRRSLWDSRFSASLSQPCTMMNVKGLTLHMQHVVDRTRDIQHAVDWVVRGIRQNEIDLMIASDGFYTASNPEHLTNSQLDMSVAGFLYLTQFEAMNEQDEKGLTPIMQIACRVPRDNGADLWGLVGASIWMIRNGASLGRRSATNATAAHYLAGAIGQNLALWEQSNGRNDRESLLADYEFVRDGGRDLLCALILDNARDICSCACSTLGCTPLSKMLHRFLAVYPPGKRGTALQFFVALMAKFVPKASYKRIIVGRFIQYATFDALGCVHSCQDCTLEHGEDGNPNEAQPGEPTGQLGGLLSRLLREYYDGEHDLVGFFEGPWRDEIDQIAANRGQR
ncbi:uncharacterized protein DSM5745_11033 [Aspergillus mulundensis]|uniref:Fungal N-terminal domain-containing protein n=1 Tax=Aspergillus mulundensis TaxID=1810919 RepID=A0A3D8QCK7_9EURO|nr:hypothetical protein DSM5745_11033 [Aspergillus mulundensis]RDW59338.1 hypothetical protein DSM5745_11033 [Aspergillus mulundensis]